MLQPLITPGNAAALGQWIWGGGAGGDDERAGGSRNQRTSKAAFAATDSLLREGEEHHFPVHGRWAVADRYVRPEAAAESRARRADQDEIPPDAVHSA